VLRQPGDGIAAALRHWVVPFRRSQGSDSRSPCSKYLASSQSYTFQGLVT
jgi:hypothetical protein